MKQLNFYPIFIVFFIVTFVSCTNKGVFNEFKAVPKSGWSKDSLMVFNIPVTDTLHNNNMYINVRNSISYSYSNLWLFVEIVQPGGEALKDTFEISLADPAGKWLGQGMGGVKTCEVVYRRDVYFPVAGTYKVKIQQGMRENNLEGISDIGVRVEKSGS